MTEAEQYFVDQIRQGRLRYIPETGRLWRVCRVKNLRNGNKSFLCCRTSELGYLTLGTQPPGRKWLFAMQHRVIWEAFVGPIPENYEINHKDFDKSNNRLSNLEAVTQKANLQHSWTKPDRWIPRGDLHVATKIREVDVLAGREQYRRGEVKIVELAAKFGVSQTYLSRLFIGKATRISFRAGEANGQ